MDSDSKPAFIFASALSDKNLKLTYGFFRLFTFQILRVWTLIWFPQISWAQQSSDSIKDSIQKYLSKNDLDKAIYFAERRVEVLKTEKGERSEAYASGLNTFGSLLSRKGQIRRAENILLQAFGIYKKLEIQTKTDLSVPTNTLGWLYFNAGDYQTAKVFFKESLDHRLKANHPDSALIATSLDNLGSVLVFTGELSEAEKSLKRALEMRKRVLGPQHPFVATSENNLANYFKNIGQLTKAELGYKRAIEVFLQKNNENSPTYAIYANNLGSIYRMKGEFDQAMHLAHKTLKIRKKNLGPDHPNLSISYNSIGSILLDQKKYQQAIPALDSALQILRKNLPDENPEIQDVSLNLGHAWLGMGDVKKADSIFSKIFWERKRQLGILHPKLMEPLIAIAGVSIKMGNLKKADSLMVFLSQNQRHQVREYFPFLSQMEREKFNQNFEPGKILFQSYCAFRGKLNPGLMIHFYEHQLETKGLLINSFRKTKSYIQAQKDSLTRAKLELWQSRRQTIAKAKTGSLYLLAEELEAFEIQAEKLEKELFSGTLEKIKGEHAPGWQTIKKALQPGEALVEMVRVKSIYFLYWKPENLKMDEKDSVWYVALILNSNSRHPIPVILKNGNNLENSCLAFYRKMIQYQGLDEQSFQYFWQNISLELGKQTKKIFFSPDGAYHFVNLNTLFNSNSKKYLMDELEIQLLLNSGEITSFQKNQKFSRNAIIIGYPDFNFKNNSGLIPSSNDSIPKSHFEFDDFEELPGTKTEVLSIHRIFLKNKFSSEIVKEEKATETFLKKVQSPGLVHIASHGFFARERKENQDPMLQGGVVLAGANHGGDSLEDGILTALEARELQLEKTEIVVLSACETGLGKVKNGEGVYGLQRAFLEAGARSLIMSLWKVNDDATQELMVSFYKHWLGSPHTSRSKFGTGSERSLKGKKANGKDALSLPSGDLGGRKRSAFLKAQKELKAKYPNPYFWGAFVLVGI